jgi:hypothetical protein
MDAFLAVPTLDTVVLVPPRADNAAGESRELGRAAVQMLAARGTYR